VKFPARRCQLCKRRRGLGSIIRDPVAWITVGFLDCWDLSRTRRYVCFLGGIGGNGSEEISRVGDPGSPEMALNKFPLFCNCCVSHDNNRILAGFGTYQKHEKKRLRLSIGRWHSGIGGGGGWMMGWWDEFGNASEKGVLGRSMEAMVRLL
jgi:hypothetical protein